MLLVDFNSNYMEKLLKFQGKIIIQKFIKWELLKLKSKESTYIFSLKKINLLNSQEE